jgi:hypothetical protein
MWNSVMRKETEEITGGVGETCLVVGFIIFILHVLGSQMKGEEMARGCSTCKKNEKHM